MPLRRSKHSHTMNPLPLTALCLLTALAGASAEALVRTVPRPMSSHPGNIFLTGEDIALTVPADRPGPWRVLDYEDKPVANLPATAGQLKLGRLPTGFFRLVRDGESDWVSLAVIEPLKTPTPKSSPVALDVAMAWFYPKEKMDAASSLCALAGVNWVRDRLSWGEIQPKSGQWLATNRYEHSAQAQAQAGLQVLQVNHSSPQWANPSHKRFPLDLRDAYRFHRELARRWQGRVQAFEPWNEADISVFGGHTGAEMASLQKAAYLGLKAGNPTAIACLNVFASHNRAQLEDLRDNAAWPYFDTFNLHHYAGFDEYPRLYADFRAVSAGKPLWVSECALPVKWAGDEKLKEPSIADSRTLAERVAKVFACSLHEGSIATFYFLLPHYAEDQTQFGILRPDLTPRPGYVALAAVGRLLADAKALGRLHQVPETVRAYLFRALPDGNPSDVLVAWTTKDESTLSLPSTPVSVFDHLGRTRPATTQLALTTAPVFAVLPKGSASQFVLQATPPAPELLAETPSTVVLQALWPEDKVLLKRSAYRLSSERTESVPLLVYNFGNTPATGSLEVKAPDGWKASQFSKIDVPPQGRAELLLELDGRNAARPRFSDTVRVTGDFGSAGEPVLSLVFTLEPNLLTRRTGTAIAGADDNARWQKMISGDGPMTISSQDSAVVVEAEPKGADKWVYPRLPLPLGQAAPAGVAGLCCTLTLLEGDAQFKAIFDEENGSSYAADLDTQPKPGQTVEALALFENATHGTGWSKPDPNGRLDADQIQTLKIGCNLQAGRVKFTIKNLRWVKD